MNWTNWISFTVGAIVCFFLAALAANILYRMWVNDIDLSTLVSGSDGNASMSRLQLLIFTFVIAISFLMIVERDHKIPDVPNGVLLLLGISASTYAVGKSISQGSGEPGDPVRAAQAGAVAGAAAGAQTGAQTGAVSGAQAGAQSGAVTGAQAGAQTGAIAGAVMGAQAETGNDGQ